MDQDVENEREDIFDIMDSTEETMRAKRKRIAISNYLSFRNG
jgi:hypothetical protein